jgi:hypothetical protein
MKRTMGCIGLAIVAVTCFQLALARAQEQEICADALFTPALPQQFLPGANPGEAGTPLPFTVNFGTAFFSISRVVASSTFAASDPIGPGGSFFIDKFGGFATGGTLTSRSSISGDPVVLNQFLSGSFQSTVENDAQQEYEGSTDTFTLTSLRFCATGVPEEAIQIGASVTGLSPRIKTCKNITTGQVVMISDAQQTWDCVAAGLQAAPKDHVLIRVRGIFPKGERDVTGKVTGIAPVAGACANLTTGQTVEFRYMVGDTEASCAAAGLVMHWGDTVMMRAQGPVE